MIIRFFLVPLLFLSLFAPPKDIDISAESAILVSPLVKRVIYSKNPHKKLAPASTVKIMTALLTLKNGDLDNRLIVSKFASSMEPSKIYIKEGEEYTRGGLVRAILLNSGNDASVALAENVGGAEKDFVMMMNMLAEKIGAKNTNFTNSNGLPDEKQYSTAYDLALVVREAMKDKRFVSIMNLKYDEIEELKTGRKIKLKNHNKSLWKDKPYVIVGKTGYTKKAKHCFAGYIQYNRWRRVIVVILKSNSLWKDLEVLAESML
ncbi:MAG: D-alanyl-D-alanine carboxypeptidase family protein [Candidatus Omnitrophota bacterium]